MPKKQNHFRGLSPAAALAKLNSLPTTRVDVPYETPRQRIERELREEEAEKIQRRTAPIVASETMARISAEGKIKRFWSQPMTTLAQVFDPNGKRSTWADALVPRNDKDGQLDVNLGTFPTTSSYTLEAALAAFENFKKTVTAKTGVCLSTQGEYRVFAFVMIQSDLQSADPAIEKMYFIALDRLRQLEAFADDELGYDENLRTELPELEPVAAPSLEEIDSSTPEGREREKHLVREAFRDENTPLFYEWCASLANGFGLYITDEQQRAAISVFREYNFSPRDRRNYDRCRKILVRRGIFPSTASTAEERLSETVETLDMNNRDNRIAFLRESERLRREREG